MFLIATILFILQNPIDPLFLCHHFLCSPEHLLKADLSIFITQLSKNFRYLGGCHIFGVFVTDGSAFGVELGKGMFVL